MRIVPLKTVKVRLAGQPAGTPDLEFTYADTIFGILNSTAGEKGVTLAEIGKALRVITPVQQAVEAGEDHVMLEDADWEFLKRHAEGYRGWRLIHPCVETFVSEIAKAGIYHPAQAASAEE